MYTKQTQLVKKKTRHCRECKKDRLLKFFDPPKALKCTDCKRSSAFKKRMNRPKKVNDQKDSQWSRQIKERDGNACTYCGKREYLNAHHIFSRNNRGLRWDLDNGITLCAGCHTMSSKFSAHKTPADFIEWIKEERGLEWYDRLRAKAKQVHKEGINPYQNELNVSNEGTGGI